MGGLWIVSSSAPARALLRPVLVGGIIVEPRREDKEKTYLGQQTGGWRKLGGTHPTLLHSNKTWTRAAGKAGLLAPQIEGPPAGRTLSYSTDPLTDSVARRSTDVASFGQTGNLAQRRSRLVRPRPASAHPSESRAERPPQQHRSPPPRRRG